jgi:hypothetical protein
MPVSVPQPSPLHSFQRHVMLAVVITRNVKIKKYRYAL